MPAVVDRPGIDSTGDAVADLACWRTRPYRSNESPYVIAAKSRLRLATVLPRSLVVFAGDGFGGRGIARRQIWRALRGLAVADEIEAAGVPPDTPLPGAFLTVAEIYCLRGDPPTWAQREVDDRTAVSERWRLYRTVNNGEPWFVTWRAVAERAPDAGAAEILDDADLAVLRDRIASYEAPLAVPERVAEDLVKLCVTMAAWHGTKWARKPDGEVEVECGRQRSVRSAGGVRNVHRIRMPLTHPAEALSLALSFLGVTVTADDLQRQISERYARLREAWATGEQVTLPNGRTIPPRVFKLPSGGKPATSAEPLPLFPKE